MGSIRKKTYTKPIPAGAELIEKSGKSFARVKPPKGRAVIYPLTISKDGSQRIVVESATYVAKYRDGSGIIQEVSTSCRDEGAARSVLAEFERRAELVRSGVISAAEDRIAEHQRNPIAEHFDAWVVSRQAKGVTANYLDDARRYLDRLARECRFVVLADLNREAFEKWLAHQTGNGMSARSRNTHRTTWFAFCNWCVETGRLLNNPFVGVHRADEKADRRRQRRAMTEDELKRLLKVARWRPLAEFGRDTVKTEGDAKLTTKRTEWKAAPLSFDALDDAVAKARVRLANNPALIAKLTLRGREQALIYKTLVTTGLRKNELATVRVRDLALSAEPPSITLEAKNEKNREGNTIPLRADLASDLREWLTDRLAVRIKSGAGNHESKLAPDEALFEVPDKLVKILNRDLEAAGIPKRDDRGRTLDVHALRTTFGTHLSKAGVPLRTAQAAMRHSSPMLTANIYTDPKLLDIQGAVEALPELKLDATVTPLTGTPPTDSSLATTFQLAPLLAPSGANLGQAESFAVIPTASSFVEAALASFVVTPDGITKNASKEVVSFEASVVGVTGFEPATPWSQMTLVDTLNH